MEEHVCVNDCFLFPCLPKSAWKDHSDDICPVCETKRFEFHGKSIIPKKKFFRIPLSFQIENMKANPRFRSSLLKMKEQILSGVTATDSFWGATLAKDILDLEDINLDRFTRFLILSLGLDGVNCFKSANYSVWPVCFKIWNLHPEERTSKEFLLLGCLIPGFLFHHFKQLCSPQSLFNQLNRGFET